MLEKVINGLAGQEQSTALTVEEFAHLYETHITAVFNYCLFRLGEQKAAEDLAADIIERAWRNRHRYRRDQAAFTTWLFTIARRLLLNQYRQEQRHPIVALDENQPDREPLPELLVLEAEQMAKLRRLVRSLADSEQELIALKFGVGLTNRQIGEILGKSESAVGSALYRIMQHLRQQWLTLPAEEEDE
jgi:RNA polymerase sigma-70 factor, ECF subfamily